MMKDVAKVTAAEVDAFTRQSNWLFDASLSPCNMNSSNVSEA